MQTKNKRLENLAEVGHNARKEAEDFLNRWLDDGSKGWAIRRDLLQRYEDRFSAPLAIYLN
jgi:hypothetical protein